MKKDGTGKTLNAGGKSDKILTYRTPKAGQAKCTWNNLFVSY
jgi:hypothetical protein